MSVKECVIGKYCRRHNFIHGAEAEELRKRFEELVKEGTGVNDDQIQRILDEVDARDSLAYLEAKK